MSRFASCFVSLVALLAGAGCATYSVRQSSVVPAAMLPPPPATRGTGDLYVGDGSVTFLSGDPELAPSEHAGLWIPRTQLNGSATYRWPHVGIRGSWLVGFPQGAMAAAPTTLRNPDQAVFGFGPGILVRPTPPGSELTLTATFDSMLVSVPSYLEATCTTGCEGARPNGAWREREALFLYSLTATTTWRASSLLDVFLTFGVQNHPTNVERFDTTELEPEVQSGPINLLVAVGAELHLTRWLSLVPQVQWPVTAEPVRYGPILSFGLRTTAHREASDANPLTLLGPQPAPSDGDGPAY